MRENPGAMILQQMYTRERRGVYRGTEGFDTVAKSERLDSNFVKKIIHPFCLYDAPSELTARGEKDEALYPPALHLFHAETGETVIGQSRYLAVDFTGQRSAFFAHNFVVPPARSGEIIREYGRYLHAGFADRYEGEPGGTLPELAEVPERQETGSDAGAVLAALGISEEMFKALLQSVMLSVAGKKKVYVALDVPIDQLSGQAARLTEVLFGALPYEFRRRLGVLTYAKEPQNRKYIHLTFVEKGAIRPGDRNLEKDFVFDFAAGRFSGAEMGDSRQPYADLAWRLLGQGEALEDFAGFADALTRDEAEARKLSLALYNELAVFYEIEQGNEGLYAENKNAVLAGLLTYLSPDGAIRSRERLNDLFLMTFDREYDALRTGEVPELEILERFREYYGLNGHNYRTRIVDYYINGLLNSARSGREDLLEGAYRIIEGDEALGGEFFRRVLAQPTFRKMLFEPYAETRLKAAGGPSELLRIAARWGKLLPEALQQPQVLDLFREVLLEKLRGGKDPVTAVAAIHESLAGAEKEHRRGGVPAQALTLMQELADAADRFLLNQVVLDELSQEQLLDIRFLQYRSSAVWEPPLDLPTKQKLNSLRAAYRWFGEENPDETIFAGLSMKELDDVQLLGRRWLKEAGSAEPFERLPLAFYISEDREGGPLDYDALLEHVLRKAGKDKETVYRFLAWSQRSRLFVSGKKLQPNYRRAILKYFMTHDREAFKNREFRKTYADKAGPALQSVYADARAKLASPVARWLGRSKLPLLLSGIVLGLAVITVIVIAGQLGGGADTAAPPASTSPTASPAESGPPPVTVRLDGGADSGNRLVFTFADAAECTSFSPKEVDVVGADGQASAYAVKATISRCTASSPSVTPAADTGSAGDNAAADNAGGTDDAAAADGSGTGNTAAADTGSGGNNSAVVPAPTADAPRFEVTLQLEAGAKLAAGDMITAGDYKLRLEAAPAATADPTVEGTAPTATAGDEPDKPTATPPSSEPEASATAGSGQ